MEFYRFFNIIDRAKPPARRGFQRLRLGERLHQLFNYQYSLFIWFQGLGLRPSVFAFSFDQTRQATPPQAGFKVDIAAKRRKKHPSQISLSIYSIGCEVKIEDCDFLRGRQTKE